MLFMGEEWAAPEPFVYFCDFEPELAQKVREGRKREFAQFKRFAPARARALPDPTIARDVREAKLDWSKLQRAAAMRAGSSYYRRLLAIRAARHRAAHSGHPLRPLHQAAKTAARSRWTGVSATAASLHLHREPRATTPCRWSAARRGA